MKNTVSKLEQNKQMYGEAPSKGLAKPSKCQNAGGNRRRDGRENWLTCRPAEAHTHSLDVFKETDIKRRLGSIENSHSRFGRGIYGLNNNTPKTNRKIARNKGAAKILISR